MEPNSDSKGVSVSTLAERVDGLRRETEYRYNVLKDDTNKRHDENKELLTKIFEQTKTTNGSVTDLKVWRRSHEEVTEERLKVIDKRFTDIGEKVEQHLSEISAKSEQRFSEVNTKAEQRFSEVNTKAEAAHIALNLINNERLIRQGELKVLKFLWIPISALVGSVAGHFFPILEKLLKLP